MKLLSRIKPQKGATDSNAKLLFTLNLILPGRKLLQGRSADLTTNGAVISFASDGRPDFDRDERVRLSLTIIETGKTVPIDALVRDSNVVDNARACQFSLIDTSSLLRDVDPAIRAFFNRRDAFRVIPDPLNPIEADVTWGNNLLKGKIIDISVTGILLGVSTASRPRPHHGDLITLGFQLPEDRTPTKMLGRIVKEIRTNNGFQYGVKFNRKETTHFSKCQRAIAKYLMRRQRSILKRQ